MGYGKWKIDTFEEYCHKSGRLISESGDVVGDYTAQEMFCANELKDILNPKGVIRECCDSEEHPQTVPVILALDVTGSMGSAAVEVAKRLNTVMTKLYETTKDVEFMIMGIGDLAYDRAPIQASQFESDIRIAEQLDQIYFEGGGGGNCWESYTAAWFFALNHTRLDCHKRGKKGLIITMGDEPLNPHLPKNPLAKSLGGKYPKDIETSSLYQDVIKKFEVYHLAVISPETSGKGYENDIDRTFGKYLDHNHLKKVNLDNITPTIIDIVSAFAGTSSSDQMNIISW